jgi:hypothetical protein
MKKFALCLVALFLLAASANAQSITGTFGVNPTGTGIVGNGSYNVGAGRLLSIDMTVKKGVTQITNQANSGGNLWDDKQTEAGSGTWKCWATMNYLDACGNFKQISCAPQNVTVP